jgi:hypothetical protein
MTLLERIGERDDIPFKHEKILQFPDLEGSPFVTEIQFHTNASVPVADIIGSGHTNYVNMSWIDLLLKGQRTGRYIKMLDTSPDYHYAHNIKASYSFNKIPHVGYFIEDGNNRTAIAKFLFFVDGRYNESIHGVTVNEYFFDEHGIVAFEELQATISAYGYKGKIDALVKQMEIINDDPDNKSLDKHYYTRLTVGNTKTNAKFIIENFQDDDGVQKVKRLIHAIKHRKWWSRWFSKNEFAKIIG